MIKRLLMWPIRLIRPTIQSLLHSLGGEAAQRRRTANRMAGTMLHEFTRLGFVSRSYTEGKRGRRKRKKIRVRYEYPLLLTHDELWCPIDLANLPDGKSSADLADEWVTSSLEERLNAAVRVDRLASGKLCFVVRISGSAFPETYSINQVKIEPDAPALTVPFGVDHNGDPVNVDLIDIKHLMIAGATGGGKTTLQHAMISTLISRNTADDIELWLVDMKRTEFALYRPLTGKRNEGGIVRQIAVEPEDAVQLLDSALREINRRNKLMEQHSATNLADLALSTGIKLKRIVLVVDEFAMLTLNTEKIGKQSIGTVSTSLMARIAALGRSSGVTIVIATQMVNKEVLSSMIRANFENRVCFSTADWRQSQLVVESSEADGLPPGRAILRREGRTTEVQTCLITARQVRIEVDRISEFGPEGAWGQDIERARLCRDAKLLVEAACQNFAGDMPRAKILQLDGVRGVISQERFNEVAARLERDGVVEPGRSNKPRKVSRGFFGRSSLIDLLYGAETAETTSLTTEPTTGPTDRLRLDDDSAVVVLSDGPEDDSPDSEPVVCGLEESSTHALDPDEAEQQTINQYNDLQRQIKSLTGEIEIELKKPRKRKAS